MKNILLVFGLLFVFFGHSQSYNPQQQTEFKHLQQLVPIAQKRKLTSQDIGGLPIYSIHGLDMVSIFGIQSEQFNSSYLQQNGCIVGKPINGILTLKVPVKNWNSIDFSKAYCYIEIPGKIYPELDKAVHDTKADSVRLGLGLPEAYTGKDVYIGITDWGFDYSHPMFYDSLLTQTRVIAAWDQYKQEGNMPSYGYGVTYSNSTELLAAGSDTANIYSYHTHGSHVAGIAGGAGAGIGLYGFAPASNFLFTTFLIDAASVIDAYSWMNDRAIADGKRLVINMSWGLYYMGTLDGNSLLSQAIAGFSNQGVVFVSSAGNNGGVNFHIKRQHNGNYFQSKINFYSYSANPNMWGQSITMWGEENHDFNVQLRVFNAANSLVNESDTFQVSLLSNYVDTFMVVGVDTIWYNVEGSAAHPLNNRPTMRLRVKSLNTNYNIALKSWADSGTVHYWNVTELTTGVGNWGMPFSTFSTNGIPGDPFYSIGEPTCAQDAISVAAYSSGYINAGGYPAGGQIASFSSYGPLYTEEIKPDISAPGVSVLSSISSYTDASYSAVESVSFNGRTYDFARMSGTSMSSPAVTGIVALILDANSTLSSLQVKQIIQLTARLDQYTGTIVAPGDVRWGMGKINAYAAVVLALNTIGVHEQILSPTEWTVFPNPAKNMIQVKSTGNNTVQTLSSYTATGQFVSSVSSDSLDISNFSSGIYFLVITSSEGTTLTRFVKE